MKKTTTVCIFLFYLHIYSYADAFPKNITTESFIIHYLENKRITPIRVELNTEKQTERVSFKEGETLYDFNEGKVAYKDFSSSQCFIADILEETLERDRRRLRNLKNGVIRGFFVPTFTIEKELNNRTEFSKKFGIHLSQFCDGNIISSVTRQQYRRKRDTSDDRGQFTHHTYGHYGHQSNNYAHYGHETHVTGNVDKDGNIQNQQVSQNQVRTVGSNVYPIQDPRHGLQASTTDSRTGIPTSQYQSQHQIPSLQRSWGNNNRHLGSGGSGQFAFQNMHESGYQLTLPLGITASNAHRSNVQNAVESAGASQPQIPEHSQYPYLRDSGIHQPGRHQIGVSQTRPLDSSVSHSLYPPVVQTPLSHADRTRVTGRDGTTQYTDLDQMKDTQSLVGISTHGLPAQTHPGSFIPVSATAENGAIVARRADVMPTSKITDMQTDSRQVIIDAQRQPGRQISDYESRQRAPTDQRTTTSDQRIPTILDPIQLQTTDQQTRPGTLHASYPISSHRDTRQQTSRTYVPQSQISGIQTAEGRPDYQAPSLHTDFRHQQSTSEGIVPSHQMTHMFPGQSYTNGHLVPGSQIPDHYQRPITPSHPPRGTQDIKYSPGVPLVISPAVPGIITPIPHASAMRSGEPSQNGVFYPGGFYPGTVTENGQIYQRTGTPIASQATGIQPSNGRSKPISSSGPDDTSFLQPDEKQLASTVTTRGRQIPGTVSQPIPDPSLYASRTLPTRISPELAPPISGIRNGHFPGSQIGAETFHGLRDQSSASSQTQIQTSIDGTAAEASAAGKYQGLGSQTQVQGGYVGNGSFSAQAQSGFTGGVVQSQVQGNKQGGLSGSSAHVERVGAAQSQVQIGQPNGSASSSAQGRFLGGITQVQAQGSKSRGSAGAQSHSTGLSSSHVQVNIGGRDASDQERFHGAVSASVHGGHSSGQSQTQLQGGYDSGRTYVATAQGGFDRSIGFDGSLPDGDSSAVLVNQARTTYTGSSVSPYASNLTFARPLAANYPLSGTHQVPLLGREDKQLPDSSPLQPVDRSLTHQAAHISRVPQTYDSVHPPSDNHIEPVMKPDFLPQQRAIVAHDSRIGYPGLIPEAPLPRLPPHSQTNVRYPYSRHPFDTTIDSKPMIVNGGYQGHITDQRGLSPPRITPAIQEKATPPQTFVEPSRTVVPGYHGGIRASPQAGLMQPSLIPSYPSSLPRSQEPVRQHYTPDLTSLQQPPGSDVLSQPSHSAQHMTSYPLSSATPIQPIPQQHLPSSRLDIRQYPGSGPIYYQPASHFPEQTSSVQEPITSLQRPDSTRVHGPDGRQYPRLQPRIQVTTEQSQMPSSQTFPLQSHHERPTLTKPDGSLHVISQPTIHQPPLAPIQPQISEPRPQITHPTTTTARIPTSATMDSTHTKLPGVSEPDKFNCCEALRDLKRRCCGRGSETHDQQSFASPCCSSSTQEFDFNLGNNDEENKMNEPCKVVKAICYIVYKPVGKARICKPTDTNSC